MTPQFDYAKYCRAQIHSRLWNHWCSFTIEPNFLSDGLAALLETILLLLLAFLQLLAEQFVVHIKRLVHQFFFCSQQKCNQGRIALLVVKLVQSLPRHAFAFATELLEAIVMNTRADLRIEAQLAYPAQPFHQFEETGRGGCSRRLSQPC